MSRYLPQDLLPVADNQMWHPLIQFNLSVLAKNMAINLQVVGH
jgi:hypothetical protein